MVTAIQAQVAAQRAADPSYQRALANATKAGSSVDVSRLQTQMGLNTPATPTNVPIIDMLTGVSQSSQISRPTTGGNTMPTAGQDLTLYQQVDTMVGGMLPGGVQPTAGGVAAATRIAGYSVGTAVVAGVGYAAYKYFTKDGTARKTKANGQPYKRPTMNYANPKALARSERRLKSYIKHARKHVSAMGYAIKRKGSDK